MKILLAVFLGGGIGSVLRYFIGIWVRGWFPSFIIGTLIANILAGFLLGLSIAFFQKQFMLSNALTLFLTVGICGGLSTFSTFSYEIFQLFQEGQYLLSIGYMILSVVLCIFAILLGFYIIK